jgi:TRAP-type C4-dicarboxylate transport system substrate-binding protein
MVSMTRWLTPVLLAAGLLFAPQARADAPHTLRIATLAPKNSAWGKVFKIWAKAIDTKTEGKLGLDVYYNAVQGDEHTMVTKMKSGQLDGAALTSVGLSQIYRNVLVLQLPGVIDSWAALDKVRTEMQPDLEKSFANEGFTVVGWGDVGLVRQMSKGFAIKRPSDMKGKSPGVWRDEPMGPTVYATIGGIVPVPVSVPEVLPALRQGKINVVNAPALAAEQLQWVAYFDHVGSNVSVCAIGGTIFRKKALDDLPADVRQAFTDIQKRMDKSNASRVRGLDEQAYERMKSKMTVVDMSQADMDEWAKVLREAVKRLSQGTFDKAMVDRVLKITGKS